MTRILVFLAILALILCSTDAFSSNGLSLRKKSLKAGSLSIMKPVHSHLVLSM
ncbi:unnamed protein product, partial [Heterosigma akashiwo]